MEITQPSTNENSENSKTESVTLLSQALGRVTGVLVPRTQIYSSHKILTDILGPLNSFKFHSLEKAPFEISGVPFPVEVRDSSDGVLFRFFGRPAGQVVSTGGQYGGTRAVFMAVLVDSFQRELLYVKPDFIWGYGIDPGFNLSCKEGVDEQTVGKVNASGLCAFHASYRVTALNLFTNQSSGSLMEAHGTGFNCCCSITNTLLFGYPDPNAHNRKFSGNLDPRVVAKLKRLSNSTSNNPNGASQVNFDQKLPIVHKIWILFICYHHHYRNFANTSCSRNGQRGSFTCFFHSLIWPFAGLTLLLLGVLPLMLVLATHR